MQSRRNLFVRVLSLLVLVSSLALAGCESASKAEAYTPSVAEYYLGGKHQLRKFADDSKSTHQESGWWFVLIGGSSKKDILDAKVAMWWQMNDGSYALTRIPLEKIRIMLDESATTPTVEFEWRGRTARYDRSAFSGWPTQSLVDQFASHAVLTVRPEDWPIRMDLPQN